MLIIDHMNASALAADGLCRQMLVEKVNEEYTADTTRCSLMASLRTQ